MATNRLETTPAPAASAAPGQSAKAPGGFSAWLPLLVAVVLMPALSYVTTTFVLLPQLRAAAGAGPAASGHGAAAAESHGVEPGKPKQTFPLNKVLVNISGQHQRYLIANYTLVGTAPDFKTRMEENKDQLLDLATGIMSTKSINDLEKPGIRNLIRSELLAAFNNALGGNVIKEIYITEFAIQ